MGAALDLMRHVAGTLEIEANGVTDNPLIFPDGDDSISGGNFHAQPVAFAADMLTMAMCEVGSISERRTAVLVDPKMRSEERRVGKECVSTWRSRWSRYH